MLKLFDRISEDESMLRLLLRLLVIGSRLDGVGGGPIQCFFCDAIVSAYALCLRCVAKKSMCRLEGCIVTS